MRVSVNDENSPADESPADEPTVKHEWDDPAAPLWNGLKYGVTGLGVLLVAGLLIFWPWKGTPGLWGVLIGAGIGGTFILITVITILLTRNALPAVVMGALMGSYLVKVVAAIAVTALIKDMDFYHKGALATTLIGAIIAVLGAELWGVMSTRQTYTDSDGTTAQ